MPGREKRISPSYEIAIRAVTGYRTEDEPSTKTIAVEGSSDATIEGRYMSVTLSRLLVNLPMISDEGEPGYFTLLAVDLRNLWDYQLITKYNTLGIKHKLIDSLGFQYEVDMPPWDYRTVVLEDGESLEVRYEAPERYLEAHARTTGWFSFGTLLGGAAPERFIFRFPVFDAGQTGGWVRDEEVLEFVITDYEAVPYGDPR